MIFLSRKRRRITTSDFSMACRRLNPVRTAMTTLRLHSLLVTELTHIRYLTGFSGSNGICVITPISQFFITDRRYKLQAPHEVKGFTIFIAKQNLYPVIIERKLIPRKARIGFESQYISVEDMKSLKKLLPNRRFVPTTNILEDITAVKDKEEVELIRSAARITDRVFKKIVQFIKPGVRECDIAAEISYWHRRYGAECDAFDPIVASGERSALPHARASDKIIRKGEMVVLDFGCRYRGYHSDLTRTIIVGKPSDEMKKTYRIVLKAQVAAIDRTRSGVSARSVDAAARKYIRKSGYGRYFVHSLGHGLGIQVHEPLRLSMLSTAVLKKGNVVTIEPGIYLPGRFGVRIEDDVVVGEHSCDVLTASPKEFINV